MRNGDFSATIVVAGNEHAGQADGVVPVAFGTEYAIRLRTHNGRRAVAEIWIDDINVTAGHGVILPVAGYVDIETPPSAPGSRFRFASSESDAAYAAGKGGADHDGTKGLIRIDFKREVVVPAAPLPMFVKSLSSSAPPLSWQKPSFRMYEDVGAESCGSTLRGFAPQASCCSSPKFAGAESLSSGVTVAGSSSAQTFREAEIEIESVATTVLLKLKGRVSHAQPAYVGRATQSCSRCGTPANLLSNYCQCGQRLHL